MNLKITLMNCISCIIRILEIPSIKLGQNPIPGLTFRVELAQDGSYQNSSIIEAQIWGDLAEDFQKYYFINDYLLIEGYFSMRVSNHSNKKIPILTIFQIYPFLLTIPNDQKNL
uniref:Single-stranded DNA binding protein n=1 Tax=Licmophora sp. TaxID=2115823 RepID=A0A2U9NP95_9STRA|nr:hypothetical protein ycf41 [Licmophora sp.]